MLKIKEEIDLKELEKFGFVTSLKYNPMSYVKKVYLNNDNDDKNFYRISKKSRKIRIKKIRGGLKL